MNSIISGFGKIYENKRKRLVIRAKHKAFSDSVGLTVENTSRRVARGVTFAGMKAGSDDSRILPVCSLTVSDDVIGRSVRLRVAYTEPVAKTVQA